ncbi:RNA polymerase sigma factor [Ktedonobacter racemifer]|uniref:RNA polymerase, sigma-24 subunit, ECF subfamily n=1 Tax=Ktedonobacter racemifer DSM 44963 TaxID=485913 RepID=D6U780_KTERA|nr:sigma-70 family RNA polymerase sigma factor [Ktedonobacter racemifer]EFH79741.1 RNA polymerase, sigma-24 subunit, ECF subfamily [Ktedonobacter racemifer DSM 44963]
MPASSTAQLVCRHGTALESCSLCQPSLPSCTHQSLNANLNELLQEARPRLLRLARLNGIEADAAEDVVQETFFEAWRHLEKLREPERFAAWLDGICRNVCKRQARLQANGAHEVPFAGDEDEAGTTDVDTCDPLSIDPEEELERQSRQILLDRALGYLSESARELIELCYLAELPQREVAQKLDMSLGALELKLHRVRRQLRQVLNGELREDAREFGLLLDEDESMGWQETREWCVWCVQQRLRGKFERSLSGIVGLRLRCPVCSKRYSTDLIHTGDIIQLNGLRSFRTAIKRSLQSAATYFTTALHERRCMVCQAMIQVRIIPSPLLHELSATCLPEGIYIYIECPNCGTSSSSISGTLLTHTVVRNFILDRQRIRLEPTSLVTYAGQDAICSCMVDLHTSERLTIMAHPETLQIMAALST